MGCGPSFFTESKRPSPRGSPKEGTPSSKNKDTFADVLIVSDMSTRMKNGESHDDTISLQVGARSDDGGSNTPHPCPAIYTAADVAYTALVHWLREQTGEEISLRRTLMVGVTPEDGTSDSDVSDHSSDGSLDTHYNPTPHRDATNADHAGGLTRRTLRALQQSLGMNVEDTGRKADGANPNASCMASEEKAVHKEPSAPCTDGDVRIQFLEGATAATCTDETRLPSPRR